jgi:pimeloyl-ACP methyl ester carboxylesterase
MRTLIRWLLGFVALGVVCAVVVVFRPLWVQQQTTHLGLFLAHVQSNYVMTPEGRVHYYEAEPDVPGRGIPLVLVHGLGDRSEAWAPMIKQLKRDGFHVYALDLLGYGRSPKPADSDYSIATQEQLVADFIHALGLQKTDIGGWSMGGWVTLRLALDHPEMVDRVVVYDAAGLKYDLTFPRTIFHPTNAAELRRLQLLLEPNSGLLPGFIARDALRKFAGEQWVIDRGMDSMTTGRDIVDDRMSGFTEPLLIVWGSEDQLIPLSVAQRMHALDPRSELDVAEGCGHLAPALCSTRVAAATAAFLKANPALSGGERMLTKHRADTHKPR